MPCRTLVAVALVAASMLGGCSRRVVSDEPWLLDVAGPVAIDVELFAGDVRVVADPRLVQASVRVERESTHGHDRGEEALASLEEIGYAVELVPGTVGQVIRVRAETRHAEPHFQRFNVTIDVPAADGVTIHTSRGRVEARQIEGPLDVRTSEGDILIVTDLPLLEPITAMTTYGDIDLRCRGESRGELDFHALGGRVFQKIKFGKTVVHPGSTHDTHLASFNNGTNPVVLRTVDGDVRFAVEANPSAFGQFVLP